VDDEGESGKMQRGNERRQSWMFRVRPQRKWMGQKWMGTTLWFYPIFVFARLPLSTLHYLKLNRFVEWSFDFAESYHTPLPLTFLPPSF
jgi:hypothetical protein